MAIRDVVRAVQGIDRAEQEGSGLETLEKALRQLETVEGQVHPLAMRLGSEKSMRRLATPHVLAGYAPSWRRRRGSLRLRGDRAQT